MAKKKQNDTAATILAMMGGFAGGYAQSSDKQQARQDVKDQQAQQNQFEQQRLALESKRTDAQLAADKAQLDLNTYLLKRHEAGDAIFTPEQEAALKLQTAQLQQRLTGAQVTKAEDDASAESLDMAGKLEQAKLDETNMATKQHSASIYGETGDPSFLPSAGGKRQAATPQAPPEPTGGGSGLASRKIGDLSPEEMSGVVSAMAQRESGGGTLGAAVRNNNPLNIKYGGFAAGFGAQPGSAAKDGGVFARFPNPEIGMVAASALLQHPNYANLSVDQALRRWSNNGYGAEIVGGQGAAQTPAVAAAPGGQPFAGRFAQEQQRFQDEQQTHKRQSDAFDAEQKQRDLTSKRQTYETAISILTRNLANANTNDQASIKAQLNKVQEAYFNEFGGDMTAMTTDPTRQSTFDAMRNVNKPSVPAALSAAPPSAPPDMGTLTGNLSSLFGGVGAGLGSLGLALSQNAHNLNNVPGMMQGTKKPQVWNPVTQQYEDAPAEGAPDLSQLLPGGFRMAR